MPNDVVAKGRLFHISYHVYKPNLFIDHQDGCVIDIQTFERYTFGTVSKATASDKTVQLLT